MSFPPRLVALSLGALWLSLLGAEVLLRTRYVLPTAIARQYPLGLGVADSSLEVQHREFDITLRYDFVGFRESGIVRNPPENMTRVLFLGDSFVEGYGVEASQRFTNRLIEQLNGQGQRYYGFYAGQLYADPDSYMNNLVDFGIALKPDIVVMALFMGNDFMDGRKLELKNQPVREEPIDDPEYGESSLGGMVGLRYVRALVAQSWKDRPLLYRRFGDRQVRVAELFFQKPIDRSWYLEFMAPIGIDEKTFDAIAATVEPGMLADLLSGVQSPSVLIDRMIHSHVGDERAGWTYNDEDLARVLSLVTQVYEICRDRNIRLVVALLPFIGEVEPEAFDQFLRKVGYQDMPKRAVQVPAMHQQLAEGLRARGILVSDPTEALRASDTPTFYPLDQHLTPRGHEIVASELGETLRRAGIGAETH